MCTGESGSGGIAECDCENGWIDVDCSVKKCNNDCNDVGGGECVDGECMVRHRIFPETAIDGTGGEDDRGGILEMEKMADAAAERAITEEEDLGLPSFPFKMPKNSFPRIRAPKLTQKMDQGEVIVQKILPKARPKARPKAERKPRHRLK